MKRLILYILVMLVGGCSQAFIDNEYKKTGPVSTSTGVSRYKKTHIICNIGDRNVKSRRFVIVKQKDGQYTLKEIPNE